MKVSTLVIIRILAVAILFAGYPISPAWASCITNCMKKSSECNEPDPDSGTSPSKDAVRACCERNCNKTAKTKEKAGREIASAKIDCKDDEAVKRLCDARCKQDDPNSSLGGKCYARCPENDDCK